MWRCEDVDVWRCGDVYVWDCGDVDGAMWRYVDV